MFDRITCDPAVMGGRACIRGIELAEDHARIRKAGREAGHSTVLLDVATNDPNWGEWS